VSNRLLFLYSSNIRPLYEQDILDLLSAPEGTFYRFRYDERYVNKAASDSWEDLRDTAVLIHYSLQQRARYHDPVFIPVRMGRVVETRKVGRMHLVVFSLEKYVSLPAAKTDGRRTLYGEQVRGYTDFLRKLNVPAPYDFSAGLDRSIYQEPGLPLDTTSSQADLFQRTVDYLTQTQSFQTSTFLRFAYLRKTGNGNEEIAPKDGRFVVQAGETYELGVAQSQGRDVTTTTTFAISAEEGIVRLLGKPALEIASPYDLIPIAFQPLAPATLEARETVVHIDPGPGTNGPRMRINLRILPPLNKTLMGAIATGVGAALVAISTLPAALDFWRVLSVALGAAALVMAGAAGIRRA
jgi:hypothetical protein